MGYTGNHHPTTPRPSAEGPHVWGLLLLPAALLLTIASARGNPGLARRSNPVRPMVGAAAARATAGVSALSLGAGLKGEYFANSALTPPVVFTRTDATVDFNWGFGSPGGTVPLDNFSVR